MRPLTHVIVWEQHLGLVLSLQVLHHVRRPVSHGRKGQCDMRINQSYTIQAAELQAVRRGACSSYEWGIIVGETDLSLSTKMITAFSGILGDGGG